VDVELRTDARVCCAAWRPQTNARDELVPVDAARVHRVAQDTGPAASAEIELLDSVDGQQRLDGAKLVVSGGRGIGGPEGFELLSRIATVLGGALGGSLPAVDAGWLPATRQVGQSGKLVAPRLYFAVGISGTPQHLAGVAASARIVALNSDPDAPIFSVAEVGVVTDWRKLLPLLAQRLEVALAPGGA
jgi:electron transfer flavoprotein alpha subunit